MSSKKRDNAISKILKDYEKRKSKKRVKLGILLKENASIRRKWYYFWK